LGGEVSSGSLVFGFWGIREEEKERSVGGMRLV
jgi:hypothetical protein